MITVFLSGPTTIEEIFWACIKMVNSVGHSWTGAAIRGGISTLVTCMVLLMRELYAAHTGIPFFSSFSLPSGLGFSVREFTGRR